MATGEKGRGWIEISESLILDALHLPGDVRLISAQVRFPSGNAVVRLLVDAEELPAVIPEPGADWPTYQPWVTHHAERYEWNWGAADGAPTTGGES